ncbi:D-Ala-D-Ala carboxypeptidase family metallohydrolase, partial [Brevundimonas nasdae]|uniref:D-Ala-D-Ala carboxypeptidase family metallohydrolase n=1 Tax=Brevundimonas nasdae TaxID=172043 RepID=UPI003F68F056
MSGAKIASLAMITVLALASTEASSRTASLEPQLTRASRLLVKPVGASSFTLNAAAALGSHWGTVTSTTRTWEHNRLVGGVANSFHLVGRAIDIARRPGVRHADIAASFRNAGFILIESLDEGDHSHFAFALGGVRFGAANVLRVPPRQGATTLRPPKCDAIAK